MRDLTITVTGWVATDPKLKMKRDGARANVCSFRVAQTSRYFDRSEGEWVDGKTEWFSVAVYRDAAFPVEQSIRKGQPVIVEGRLRTNEWTSADGTVHTDLQIDATVVGHDLTRGVAKFSRVIIEGDEEDERTDSAEAEDSDSETDAPGEGLGAGDADASALPEDDEEPVAVPA